MGGLISLLFFFFNILKKKKKQKMSSFDDFESFDSDLSVDSSLVAMLGCSPIYGDISPFCTIEKRDQPLFPFSIRNVGVTRTVILEVSIEAKGHYFLEYEKIHKCGDYT